MAWRCPERRLAGRRTASFALAALLGAMAPVALTIVGDDDGWAVGKAAHAGGKHGDAGAAGGAGYRGGGAGGGAGGAGGDVEPAPGGGGAAGAAPGDSKGSPGPGGGAAGTADSPDSSRAGRALGGSSGGSGREPSPLGPTSTSPLPSPVTAPPRSDLHAVPAGLTQVGDDLSPAEEAALIAGKWR